MLALHTLSDTSLPRGVNSQRDPRNCILLHMLRTRHEKGHVEALARFLHSFGPPLNKRARRGVLSPVTPRVFSIGLSSSGAFFCVG